jgi:hypothetical protein
VSGADVSSNQYHKFGYFLPRIYLFILEKKKHKKYRNMIAAGAFSFPQEW